MNWRQFHGLKSSAHCRPFYEQLLDDVEYYLPTGQYSNLAEWLLEALRRGLLRNDQVKDVLELYCKPVQSTGGLN